MTTIPTLTVFAAPASGTPDSYMLKRYDSAAPHGGADLSWDSPAGDRT